MHTHAYIHNTHKRIHAFSSSLSLLLRLAVASQGGDSQVKALHQKLTVAEASAREAQEQLVLKKNEILAQERKVGELEQSVSSLNNQVYMHKYTHAHTPTPTELGTDTD